MSAGGIAEAPDARSLNERLPTTGFAGPEDMCPQELAIASRGP